MEIDREMIQSALFTLHKKQTIICDILKDTEQCCRAQKKSNTKDKDYIISFMFGICRSWIQKEQKEEYRLSTLGVEEHGDTLS